jgi:hypothetical protein
MASDNLAERIRRFYVDARQLEQFAQASWQRRWLVEMARAATRPVHVANSKTEVHS